MALISSMVLFLVSGTFFQVNQVKKAKKTANMRNTYGPINSYKKMYKLKNSIFKILVISI